MASAMAECAGEAGGGGASAAAFIEGLGFELTHPVRQAAAEAEAPAIIARRVRMDIWGPNRKWVNEITTL
jgi:hypothetical protein